MITKETALQPVFSYEKLECPVGRGYSLNFNIQAGNIQAVASKYFYNDEPGKEARVFVGNTPDTEICTVFPVVANFPQKTPLVSLAKEALQRLREEILRVLPLPSGAKVRDNCYFDNARRYFYDVPEAYRKPVYMLFLNWSEQDFCEADVQNIQLARDAADAMTKHDSEVMLRTFVTAYEQQLIDHDYITPDPETCDECGYELDECPCGYDPYWCADWSEL